MKNRNKKQKSKIVKIKNEPNRIPSPKASWEVISQYALMHNGYESKKNLAEFANTTNAYYAENKAIPTGYSLNDLKDCLFFEQRRFYHYGWAPDADDMQYIKLLVQNILEKSIAK